MRIFASLLIIWAFTTQPSFSQLSLESIGLNSFSDSLHVVSDAEFSMLAPLKGDELPEPSVMLRQTDAHAVNPFFCRLEDRIAQASKVNFRFRLGSVDYVNALEGKSYFEAVSYSRATNLYMRIQQ